MKCPCMGFIGRTAGSNAATRAVRSVVPIHGAGAIGPEKQSDGDRTGESHLAGLTPEQLMKLEKKVIDNNLFSKVAAYVQTYILAAQTLVEADIKVPDRGSASQVTSRFLEKQVFPKIRTLGGLAFFKDCYKKKFDEDQGEDWSLETSVKAIFFLMTQHLPWVENKKDIFYFPTVEEGVMAMNVTFGRILPDQFNIWDNVYQDNSLAQFCTQGLGQLYLSGVRRDRPGREIPEGAVIECSVEWMGEYTCRKPWVKYGSVVYLGYGGGGAGGCPADGARACGSAAVRLLGVYSCHYGRLFRPGDAKWEEVKCQFRSSIVTAVTLREHLALSHWIVANQLMGASREALGATHPLRRLLKPHYFGTAKINWDSKDMLMPVHGFAHRTFGFDDASWPRFFTDFLGQVDYEKHISVESLLRRGRTRAVVAGGPPLPDGFAAQLPLACDGLRVWEAMHRHADRCLGVFYGDGPAGDAALRADPDVAAFWRHFENAPAGGERAMLGRGWGLPALSRDALARFLADMIWWVTAGHEFVGSIVMYITSPVAFPPKLVEESTQADVQSFAQGLVIIAMTGVKMPALMQPGAWAHLFDGVDGGAELQARVRPALEEFQADLARVSDAIRTANDERPSGPRGPEKQFHAMDPRKLECSVNI